MTLSFSVSTQIALVFVLSFLTVAARPDQAAAQDEKELRSLPYLTNRNRLDDRTSNVVYGDERGQIDAGYCDVEGQRFKMLTAFADAAPFHIPDGVQKVENIRPTPAEVVFSEIGAEVDGSPMVLYTHGYYMDFEKGCLRAMVLQENAGLRGRFLWFSWPSDGQLVSYTHDESDLYWSVPDLSDTILKLADSFGAGMVNLAGHSLGARGIMLGIYDVLALRPNIRLGHVVLLAPDIDFETFVRLLPRVRPSVRSITIYVADADRPLAISERLHGYPRLGQSGNDTSQLVGVEVIDLSDLQVRSPTGHLYHVRNAEVTEDLDQLFNDNLPASERRNMVQVDRNLWRLQRSN